MTVDIWDLVVGVPLTAWQAADTPEKLAALLAARDDPRPPLTPPTPTEWDTYDVVDGFGRLVARRLVPRW